MKTNLKERLETGDGSRPAGAEQRLKERGIKLPAPPEPFGTYVEAVQTGHLLFLSGMLSAGHTAEVGHRSMDILHVATALSMGAKEFLSFDVNQTRLASSERLTVKP